jgi:hypothetical protein
MMALTSPRFEIPQKFLDITIFLHYLVSINRNRKDNENDKSKQQNVVVAPTGRLLTS